MNLAVTQYTTQNQTLPLSGRHILAQYDAESVIVYQAYNPSIGHFAARNGYFGGEFSYSRMSWCKPNFLWMMYRSGWGTKEGQEITLAVCLKRPFFESLLAQAVSSSYDARLYAKKSEWSLAVSASNVRLQWDPDHDPSGGSLQRRALQLGLRGSTLQEYGQSAILSIEDISAFVAEQRTHLVSPYFEDLLVPVERVYTPKETTTAARLQLSDFSDAEII